MQDLEYVEKGDAQTKGRFIALPTVASQVQAAGWRTAIASTKAVGVLLDRPGGRRAGTVPPAADFFTQTQGGKVELGSGPPQGASSGQTELGAYPAEIAFPNEVQDAWTTNSVVDLMWKNGVSPFTMIWLSEPDFTQHQNGVGSEPALAAIR